MQQEITTITTQNFDNEVTKSDKPVLLDFSASWCGPCKMMEPVLGEVASSSNGRFKVAKVNIDDDPDLANRAGVLNIPTVILYKDGEAVERITGVVSKERLLRLALPASSRVAGSRHAGQ